MKMTQHPKSLTSQGLKKSLVVALSGVLLPAIVQAEKVSSNKPIEEVMVTGSLVTRDEFDSATPIAQYTGQELLESNATSVDEFLSKTPEFTGNLGSSTNNGNNGGKMVNLRGLGFKRTLVLINGKRTVGSFIGGASDVGAVDLNQIPMHMVKRIDVFKDGASTIYGSDAIAGVINIILKNDFDGFEIAGGMGAGIHDWKGWDGKNSDVAITYGNSNETSSFVIGIEYSKQKEVYQADRSWGEAALWPMYDVEKKTFSLNELGSSNSRKVTKSDGTRWIIDAETGTPRPFKGSDTYNYAPVNALLTPNERFQATALGNKELFYFKPLGTVNFNSEFMYTKRTSQQRLAPDASFRGNELYNGKRNDLVPANNPHNPFGEDVFVNRRFVESGGRLYEQTVDTYRFSMGLNGHLDNSINWSLNYVLADDTILNETQNLHRYDRWATIVDKDLCAADPACAAAVTDQALDPFSDYGAISKKELDYLMAGPLKDKYNTAMQSLTFNINGSIAAWSDDILWALGYEKRRHKAEITPDEFSANSLTTQGSISPLNGKMSIDEFYGELSMPIISGLPLVENLIWDISARHSNYDTSAGSTTTWSTKLDWIMNNHLKSRIGYSTGFRAPNLVELNTQSVSTPLAENYCELMAIRDDLSPTARENCKTLLTKLAENWDIAGSGGDVDEFINYYQYGWPHQATLSQEPASKGQGLKPEKSKTFSFGLVFTPSFIENLSASVDYYNIKVDNYISLPDINAMAITCLNSEGFNSPICQNFSPFVDGVDPKAGISNLYGVTQNATVPYGNLGTVKSSGIDFAINYIIDLNVGVTRGFRTSLIGSYLIEYKEDFGLYGKTDYTGKATEDNVYPNMKMNIGFGIFGDNWSVDWRFRYISEAKDFLRPASATDDAIAEAVFYTDLYASYNFEETYFISMGIDNLLDQAPPQYHSGFNMRTAPGVYDTLGRQIWMKAAIKF